MGAASHLGIDLRDYDTRIRSFIPGYEEMLDGAAAVIAASLRRRSPVIVDLGIGTGALAARCLVVKPSARIVGVDEDEGMLAAARQRIGRRLTPVPGSFEDVDLPDCDAVTASLALHHLPTAARRLRLFRRIHQALRSGGVVISADCYLASSAALRTAERRGWLAHLERRYSAKQAAAYLRAWAKEDHYARLMDEAAMLERARFTVDIVWRRGSFAVIAATRGSETRGLRDGGSETEDLRRRIRDGDDGGHGGHGTRFKHGGAKKRRTEL
jgi:tRNA (cmo5U34)-methyltransferase